MGHLVVKELAEILHIHAAFHGVHHRGGAIKEEGLVNALHGPDHIAQLAYTAGLNEDPVRMELLQHLGKGFGKIPHQGAADAARVHFRDLNAGILQKTSVDADFAKFVFDQHQLFPGVGLPNELFDQGGFACA